MGNSKGKYYTELYNTITNINNHNNTPLSSANIQEAVLEVMREDEEESITDAKNFTTYTSSLASSTQRENSNATFASEKLENSDNLLDAVSNMKINNVGYELNTATASDAQVEFLSNKDKFTHTSNGITRQTLLNSRTISIGHKEVSVFTPPTNPSI